MGFDDRLRIVYGDEGLERLAAARVCLYGLGGVGAACAMDLVRSGVGAIVAVEFDEVRESNLNRLYFGYRETVGLAKTEVFADFAHRVNPAVRIETRASFFSGAGAGAAVEPGCAAHVDAIDSLNPKVNLLAALSRRGETFVAVMGTAGRLAPERLRLGSFWDSSGCPLAREVRNRLRRLGVTADFPAVWSDESAVPPLPPEEPSGAPGEEASLDVPSARPPGRERAVLGSAPFVPQAAGHLAASWVVRRILGLI
jgi:tRNA A37 threonylcarbamoyladenosine dehydratase